MNTSAYQPRVLVAVPYHSRKAYCLTRLFDRLAALTYPNKEIIIRQDPHEFGAKDNVKKQREFFRRLAIDNDFDYLFFMGADTMPPKDVIEQLLARDQIVVGGVYWLRPSKNDCNAIASIKGCSPEEKDAILRSGNGLVDVTTSGLDCMLIHRTVFEKISWMDWRVTDDDWPWCERVHHFGVPIMIDTEVQCQHWEDETRYSYDGQNFVETV